MPWLETSPMDQRKQFIADFHRGLQSVTELAYRFEMSRKTAYKWIDRHEEDGANGLANRSRRPLSCPHETPQRIVDAVLEARRHHPGGARRSCSAFFGARIRARLGSRAPRCATC